MLQSNQKVTYLPVTPHHSVDSDSPVDDDAMKRRNAEETISNPFDPLDNVYRTFDELHLKQDLLRGIYQYGFERPNFLQSKMIKAMTMGRNLVVEAPSGSSKTSSFALGVLQQIDINIQQIQALIVVPNHESAAFTSEYLLMQFGEFLGVKSHSLRELKSIEEDLRVLQQGSLHILVGTSDRLHDLKYVRHAFDSSFVKIVVIDDADKILSDGFRDEVAGILQSFSAPHNIQCCVSISTSEAEGSLMIPMELQNFIHQLIPTRDHSYCHLQQRPDNLHLGGVKNCVLHCEKEELKKEKLRDVLAANMMDYRQAIIYCNSREMSKL